ncbi:MAG: hypothetical protein ACXW1O_06500 [Halobacteriota archaeon]
MTFRGFEGKPEDVEKLVGVKASGLGLRGNPIKPGVKTLWKRSTAKFAVEFPPSFLLCEMIPALLTHTGGVEHLCTVRDQVSPEYFEIDIVLPVKNSEEQEGGFISPSTLADLYRLQVSLSFQFLERLNENVG